MSRTLKSPPRHAPEQTPLTENDYKSVQSLLAEVRRQHRLENSLVTWKNSHTLFNLTIQRHFKLPAPESERRAFIACVSALKQSGDNLIAAMGDQAAEICDNAEFKLENFTACLESLDLEHKAIELEDDPEALAKLNATFGVT